MKIIQSFMFIIIIPAFLSCFEQSGQRKKEKDSLFAANTDIFDDSVLDSGKIGLVFFPEGNYTSVKSDINNSRNRFKSLYLSTRDSINKKNILDSAGIFFTESLLNKIIPFWYGTIWDFNGYTNVPNEGVIACGYFISTTLTHAGIQMNRYKFAQQAGLNEAKTLDPHNNFHIFSVNTNEEKDSIITLIEQTFKSGLYTVGLSNHVGYLYIKNNTAYFIHSNYIDGYVMAEKARYSAAFSSSIYVLTDITYNEFFIESWILQNNIPVITN